jgi:hypothetical protein
VSLLTTSPETYPPKVAEAIGQLRAAYGELDVQPDGQGGALVTIASVPLPAELEPPESWCGFIIPADYDNVQVYGHHFRPDLRRRDGQPLGRGHGANPGQWLGRPSLSISRSSQRWRRGTDTAALKLRKVIDWLAS